MYRKKGLINPSITGIKNSAGRGSCARDLFLGMFEEFSPVSKKEWLAKIEQDLKGRSVEALNWQPEEGLEISPFAHPDELPQPPPPILLGDGLSWLIGEDFSDDLSAEDLNALLLEALNYGLESPRLAFRQMPQRAYLFRALQGVQLSYLSPWFFVEEAEENAVFELVEFLTDLYGKGEKAGLGSLAVGTRALTLSGQHLAKAREMLPTYRFIRVEGFGTAKEGVVEGLTELLQQALQAFGESRLSMADFNRLLFFEIETGSQYFLEIARLRALRLLWANILQNVGASPEESPLLDVRLVLQESGEAQQGFDEVSLQERTNTDRIAAAPLAMAALLGGADRLSIPPAGYPLQAADSFNRRIARNVHHLLRFETGLHRVADPLAGSYYVEKLTNQIAEEVWRLMR